MAVVLVIMITIIVIIISKCSVSSSMSKRISRTLVMQAQEYVCIIYIMSNKSCQYIKWTGFIGHKRR